MFAANLIRFALLAAFFSESLLFAQTKRPSPDFTDPTSVESVVKALGSDQNDVARITFLSKRPVQSAALLVRELHPVNAVRILPREENEPRWRDVEHVVWCLRALRTLTGGLEFWARTNRHFGDREIDENQEWFTGSDRYKKDRTVKFFGVWMSRDSLYIAPKDAQTKIIEKWKSWYESNGRTYAYMPFKDDPDVYYF